MGVTCTSCTHENRWGASYCGNCALPLTGGVKCPQCAAHNPSGQSFCNFCGSPLAGGKSTRTASIASLVAVVISTVSVGSGDVSSGQGQLAHAKKLTLAVVIIAAMGSILAVTRLWGLGTTPTEIMPGEHTFVLVARQIEFEGWIGVSHGILDGALAGYAYVLAYWTTLAGDDIGTVAAAFGRSRRWPLLECRTF